MSGRLPHKARRITDPWDTGVGFHLYRKTYREFLKGFRVNGGVQVPGFNEAKKRQFFLKPFINSTLFNFFLYRLFF